MEASTLILAIGVAVAVIGQAGLILWCRRAGKNHASSVVTERARLVEAAGFAAMQRDGDALLGMAAQNWKEGGRTFMHKGTNERWRDVLTEADLGDYDAAASAGMTSAMRAWAETGTRLAGDPTTMTD